MDQLLSSTSARWTTASLLKRGLALETILKGTGLGPRWLDAPDATLPGWAYERLVLNALDATGDPTLGLTLGADENLSELGVWGYAVMSSATLDEATDVGLRFWRLAGHLANIHRVRDSTMETCTLSPAVRIEEPRVWRYAVEEVLACATTALGFLCGERVPWERLEVSYARPEEHDRYRELLLGDVRFDAGRDAFGFSRSFGAQSVASRNATIAMISREQCRVLTGDLSPRDPLVEVVQNAIVGSSCRLLQLEEVARELGMGSRTLQRRLRDLGTTFQTVRDEARESLAKSLLATNLSVEDIAPRLGFSTASNFRTAFKRWTGMTVLEFRRRSR